MKLLKNTNPKRIILIIVSLVLSGAAIWFFKDTLITNYFGEKSIAATHQFSTFLLISISALLGWAIIYNLLDYLFPDNLVDWLLSCVKQRKIIISSPWKDAGYSRAKNYKTLLLALVAAYLAIFLLVFSEWVFLVTKESFMDSLPVVEKLTILIQSTWIPAVIIFVVIVVVWIFSKLLKYPIVQLIDFIHIPGNSRGHCCHYCCIGV